MERELEIDYPDTAAIPVPPEARTEPGWAGRAAQEFTSRVSGADDLTNRVARALDDLAALTEPGRSTLLLVSLQTGALAPFTLFVSEAALTRAQQADFLWSPTALLTPASARTSTEHLGEGFSATLLQHESGKTFGTRRWLFFGRDQTVGAFLGPVLAPYATASLVSIAEAVLARTRSDGFEPVADEERLAELEAACTPQGARWAF